MTKLKEYMADKGWTKEELSQSLKCNTNSVERYMRVGLTQHNRSVLYARAMGCRVIEIIENKEREVNEKQKH